MKLEIEKHDIVDLMVSVREEVEKGIESGLAKTMADTESKALHILERTRFVADEIVKKLRKDLLKVKSQVMAVDIGGVVKDLSRPMNPYLPEVLKLVKSGEKVCLVGPAGCGKTQLAIQVAEALGKPFGALTFTSGASETWLFGRNTPVGFVEAKLPVMAKTGGVFLADEMDAADPNMLMALNTMLDSDLLYNPYNGETIKLNPDFIFIGAANTFLRGADAVYSGRNRQDGALRDRFIIFQMTYVEEIDKVVCPDDEIRSLFTVARKKLIDLNSPEVLSSRSLRKAYVMKQMGFDMGHILSSTTAGWPIQTVKEAGLNPETCSPKAAA